MKKSQQILQEREDFIIKYANERGCKLSKVYYHKLIIAILELGKFYKDEVGYCGAGDSSCINESLSSKLVPDSKAKNKSCWLHDRLEDLRILTDGKLIDLDMIEVIFEASLAFDAEDIIDEITNPFYSFFGNIALRISDWWRR